MALKTSLNKTYGVISLAPPPNNMSYNFDLREQLQNSLRLNEIMEMYEKIARATPREWRIGQAWVNFLSWHMKKYGNDFYYLTDNILLKRYNEFMSEITIIPQGGN